MKSLKVRMGLVLLLLAGATMVLEGCQTLREVASLRFVDFSLDHVSNARLAGVDLSRVRNYSDLSRTDVLRLGAAIADGDLPLSFRVHVNAENPQENSVQARLVRMDWSLFLDNQKTISGIFDREVLLPPGQPTDVPIDVQLDLTDFFGNNMRELVDLALAVSGQDADASTRIKIEATPTVNTVIGPIRYPRPITIVSREVSGGSTAGR